mgnify:CR=1 FL=1
MAKPDWWPTWLPERCGNGHELGPGKVSLSWVSCRCAEAALGGHHLTYCRVDGCGWHMWPPEHIGPEPSPR